MTRSVPDIPLPTTSRHSSAHPSGTQTPTPPVSSTSQAQPPDPLIQNPLPFALDPIMSDAGENTRTDVQDTVPTPSSSPPSTPTSSVTLSMPKNTNPNYVMPLSDINKAFDSLTVLTGSENWKMWYFRVNSALRVIRHQHFKSSGLHPGNTVKLACFNAITGKIDDKIMIHYIEESDAIELIKKLKQRFDPSSTVQESNELWKLFNLCKPVWEFDKLLDEAQDLWASIKKRDIDVSDQVFYSALVGIIPPHYHFVRSSYEATVDAAAATWDATTAAEGEKPVYTAVDLIARLKKEFTKPPADANIIATAQAFVNALSGHVQVTDGGEIHWILGMEIQRNRNNHTIKLRQKHYIENILKRYNFDQLHARRTPMLPGQNLSPRPGSEPQRDAAAIKHYMSLVGGLRYVADCTRPDIAYCTGQDTLMIQVKSITLQLNNAIFI
ncbi:hypothetical protein D9758_011402 [Tetrapyrgos nigripes]|uniref:Reverse transcriptase Ty1/copia-type domain-containing protein n=1 Tax=Tetrapyrgos nigripes TaxID=182062 RepID=A0A8H5CR67_9AGAR|nr:hypothetical protein D9758_011402 [Tetrapyrgos nigripes]